MEIVGYQNFLLPPQYMIPITFYLTFLSQTQVIICNFSVIYGNISKSFY